MTKLNDKQLAALDALIEERMPSIAELRSQMVAVLATGGEQSLRIAIPTLAEIDARVLRDLVKWEYNEDGLTFKAILGPWHLCVWRNHPEGHHFVSASFRTECVSSHVSKAIQGNSYASADEAKAACMKLITDVRNELLSKLREDGMQP